MPLLGIDHIELYVGNATQAAYWFTRALGFRETAYAGLETGVRDRSSHVLEQGRVRIVLTAPLLGTSEIARHVAAHGDGVQDDRAAGPRRRARLPLRGPARRARASASPGRRPTTTARFGWRRSPPTARPCTRSSSATATRAPSCPATSAATPAPTPGMFAGVDHVVGNVELGRLDEWVGYYERVFGMTEMIHFTDRDISTEYSALMSKVMADGKGRVKFPINEPAEGQRKSQIEEYLEYYGGPGAQHIALATTDIVATVRELAERGIRFIKTPPSYYEELPGRIGEIDEDLADLRELGILADRDDEGYLLQIFSQNDRRPPDRVPGGDRAPRRPRLRRGQLQGAVRGDRARAGRAGEPLMRYTSLGEIPAKRHVQFRGNGANGNSRLLVEEVMGYEGFSGNESILYHVESPCRIAGGRRVHPDRARASGFPTPTSIATCASGGVEPGGDPISGRRCLMWNADLEVSICSPTAETESLLPRRRGRRAVLRLRGLGHARDGLRVARRSASTTTS